MVSICAFYTLKLDHCNANCNAGLHKQDWVDFKALRDFLRPFKKATVDTCGEKYPTLSLIVLW
jgi:hypothetical protein